MCQASMATGSSYCLKTRTLQARCFEYLKGAPWKSRIQMGSLRMFARRLKSILAYSRARESSLMWWSVPCQTSMDAVTALSVSSPVKNTHVLNIWRMYLGTVVRVRVARGVINSKPFIENANFKDFRLSFTCKSFLRSYPVEVSLIHFQFSYEFSRLSKIPLEF